MAPRGGSKKQQQQQRAMVYCEGSPTWNPDAYLADAELQARAEARLAADDLRGAIAASFALRGADAYVYHAITAVTLAEAQQAVSLGGAHGLHSWYYEDEDEDDEKAPSTTTTTMPDASEPSPSAPPQRPRPRPKALPPPPRADTEAYLALFAPAGAAATALRNLAANARKGSLRAGVAAHLGAKRYVHPSLAELVKLPRAKKAAAASGGSGGGGGGGSGGVVVPANPYLAFQSWASRALEWAGPSPLSARPSSHPVLAVLMHHFGCACPSHEALEVLRRLAAGREILDVGSGNGYWTRMLRDYHAAFHRPENASSSSSSTATTALPFLPLVTPVDSAQSAWRATWVPDTLVADGAAYLRDVRRGAPDAVLLLVYPVVGGGLAGGRPGGFTRDLLAAYAGDTLAVVGTQNRNGYTGFRDRTMDEFMAREHAPEWVRVVQLPLPSFPGKDEALYVFQRGPRAPPPPRDAGAPEPVGSG
ncbi:hypothetical protein SAMD00023353_3201040 [Rosellinia necatrix]|uniref:Uncharacterized protein n=1 Tax=Rosellinia necatrix TaxID=77044 RepID=A0A1S8A9T7_ROSNE|nr:hypothetical protein SAMD00023353_3201040 [Rosellinia necatrix]